MKNRNAVLVLAVAAFISSNACAQSGGALRPLNPAVASQIAGGTSPGATSRQPYAPPVQNPPATKQALKPLSSPVTAGANISAPLQALPSSQPARPVFAESAPASALAGTNMVGSSFLPSGLRLSVALERYVRERGWDIRWQIEEDYVLDANLPIPTNDLIEAVTWVVHTYQSQGGMLGVVPRFARSNQVVVIEKMDVRDNY